jgi:hypothetical protein
VVTVLPDPNKYELKWLPEQLILSRESFKSRQLIEGTEVFFTSLFTPHIGKERNYPVARFGKVALVTEEKVDWDGKDTELFLMETSSYGGNSGSPVFFYLGAERQPGVLTVGQPELLLAGVMSGAFYEDRPIVFRETAKVPVASSNIGIAAVVPAYLLRDILFSPALKKRG